MRSALTVHCNRLFSTTLREHHRLRPVLKAMKSGTRATIPAWQVDISNTVAEIEAYPPQDIGGEDGDNGEESEHESDATGQS